MAVRYFDKCLRLRVSKELHEEPIIIVAQLFSESETNNKEDVTTINDKKFEVKLPMFSGSNRIGFHLLRLCVKAALRGRGSSDVLNQELVYNILTEKVYFIISSGSVYKPVWSMQE